MIVETDKKVFDVVLLYCAADQSRAELIGDEAEPM